jgi:FMN-dependent NADH-azoreductase
MTLLIINSSLRSNSASRKLTGQFAARWTAANPDPRFIERDQSASLIPYLNLPWIEAADIPPSSCARLPSATCWRYGIA